MRMANRKVEEEIGEQRKETKKIMVFRIFGVCSAIVMVSLQIYHEFFMGNNMKIFSPFISCEYGGSLCNNNTTPNNHDNTTRITTTTTPTINHNNNNDDTLHQSRRRLGDGCYHVFLDVGANIGVHTRFLYEPDKYPNSKSAVKHFENQFGTKRDNRDFCSFGFEPNPKHKQRHEQIQSVYEQMGWKYHPLFVGVSDTAGNLTFRHMNDGHKQEWGFNSLRTHNHRGQEGVSEIVPIVRLADFLFHEIRDRRLPETVYGNYDGGGPKVVMKFDIEGMEYVTLPDLVTSGALCQTVDFCFGEFHEQYFFFPFNRTETHGGLYLSNPSEGLKFGKSLVRALHSSQHCRTQYTTEDDESYLHDGIPFPVPPNTTTTTTNQLSSYH